MLFQWDVLVIVGEVKMNINRNRSEWLISHSCRVCQPQVHNTPSFITKCYCWVSCPAVISFVHAQRWLFMNGNHEGHRVQTSVHFSLLDFHAFLSLYGSFSCVLPRTNCVMFLWNCEFSHSTSW